MIRFEAFSSGSVAESGMSSVIVARMREPADVEIGIFLVDAWCLGIKDAMLLEGRTEAELREIVRDRMPDGGLALHPACAKKLIEGSVAYAEKLGFAPHRDFRKARRVLSGLDAKTCPETFTFGHAGRPRFVVGPHDSRQRIERVLAVLRARCGDYGYDFVDIISDEGGDAGDAIADLLSDDGKKHILELLGKSRDYLRTVLAEIAPPAPTYRQLGGMLAALCVGRPADLVEVILEGLVKRTGMSLDGELERERFKEAANVWLLFQLQLCMRAAELPSDRAMPFDLSDTAQGDRADLAAFLAEWCEGFLRVPDLWPEVWQYALARPDLAPHWELLRSWARPGGKGANDAAASAGAAGGPLSVAVMALHRAFREKR